MTVEKKLLELFGDRMKRDEPLAKHLNFRIGGPADYFVEVKTVDELKRGIEISNAEGLEYFVLGGGSNTLASDDGFRGIVFKMAMRGHKIDGVYVMAEAGMISASLARATAKAGLEGFAWAISLPGTIGGAVRGNAGCFGGEMKDTVTKVEVLRDGDIIELAAKDLNFGYRDSSVKHSEDIVLRVHFELKIGDKDALMKKLDDTLAARKESQPLHAGSAGCMFKNFEFEGQEEYDRLKALGEIPEGMLEVHRISAGWVVDHLDLKGKKIGDAQISGDHGNFIVNLGKATASDIVQLVALVKSRARKVYGIQLQEEVKYLGF
jgi:UDP-N-acetylmuramate dehydrogenase